MDRTEQLLGPPPSKRSADSKEKGTPKRKKNTARSSKRKRAPPTTRLLNAEERKQIVNSVDVEKVLLHVHKDVPSKLVSQLFPEREAYWRSLLPDKLTLLVDTGVTKYLELYEACSKGKDKNSKLYLKWLEYERSLVCKSLHRNGTEFGLDSGDVCVSEDTRRTVVTLIMSTVYNGAAQQMAKEIEQTAEMGTEDPCTSSSDDVALHRICGWALKSVTDILTQQSKQSVKDKVSLNEKLELVHALKLPSDEKCNLPDALRYLDRGGLTFMKLDLLPWMRSIEDRMVALLNPKSYQRYGCRIFEVSTHAHIYTCSKIAVQI